MSFHIYKVISNPFIGDTIARRLPEYPKDRFGVIVMNNDKEVGHLPSKNLGIFAITVDFSLSK